MDKGDIWLPQKICPIPSKLPGVEADAVNDKGPITTWPQTDHSGQYRGRNIRDLAPGQGGLLNLS